MIAATGRTPRPVHAEGLRFAKLRFQNACGLQRPALGLDQCEVAIVHARAAHETAHHFGGIVAKVLQDRLGGEVANLVIGHVRNNDILSDGQPNLAAAVIFSQVGDLKHLLRRDPAYGHGKTNVV